MLLHLATLSNAHAVQHCDRSAAAPSGVRLDADLADVVDAELDGKRWRAMQTRPVLLTGASGLLGHWLLKTLPTGIRVTALTHRNRVPGLPEVRADLRDANATYQAIRRADPWLVIHAAYAKDRASIVDSTRHVVDAARDVDASVIVISTDAVFSGDGVARAEASTPDPVWDYGLWKAASERIVLETLQSAAIVRLPLLVSFDPDNHVVHEIRARAMRGETSRWFTDEMRQPALAEEVAAAIWRIAHLTTDARTGLWHLPGPEQLTRYEIAERVVDRLGIGQHAIEPAVSPADVLRPRNIVLADTRARAEINWLPSPVLR